MRPLLSTKNFCYLRTFSVLYFIVLLTTLCELKHLESLNVNEEFLDLFEEDVTEDYYMEYYDYDELDKASCEDDLPKENCTSVANAGKCGDRQDKYAMLCMKTCGYCKSAEDSYEQQNMRNIEDEDEMKTSDRAIDGESSSTSPSLSSSEIEMQEDYRKNCEDKLPTCEAHYSQEFCCQMKQSMNYSCEKTCKFCSQTPASLAPPGGNGYVPTAAAPVPTATSNQDPCRNNEGKPPSVTVDTPNGQGVPGATTTTTTTTSNPIQGALTPPPNTQLPIHP